VEGQLLSRRPAGQRDALVLFTPFARRRDQQHVLSLAASQHDRKLASTIKATQRITHIKRLNNVAEETKYLLETSGLLGERLGVVLFQLPPNMKKDCGRLKSFLELLPSDTRAAFEFRHETWFDNETFDLLRKQDCALVVSDTDDKPLSEIISTAGWGYLRLRRTSYNESDLVDWMKRVTDQKWKDAFIFFKHEDEGVGPKLAAQFLKLSEPPAVAGS